jgi:hypothetical protein
MTSGAPPKVRLPTYDEVWAKVETDVELTAIETFILVQCPDDDDAEDEFREQLAEAINEDRQNRIPHGRVTPGLTPERIDFIADIIVRGMRGGLKGFKKTWGWQQFARALIDACEQPVDVQDAEWAQLLSEAYVIVGSLAMDLDVLDEPHVTKALENFAEQRLVHGEVLPFPSYRQPTRRAPSHRKNRRPPAMKATADSTEDSPIETSESDALPWKREDAE